MSRVERYYDSIVIGSGFAGGVTACRLAEAGRKVCVLERGRRFGPGDFPVHPVSETLNVPSDEPCDGHDQIQPDVSRLFWKLGNGVWDVRDLGGLVVGQAAGLGGGSLIYANVHLRPPAHVFDERWPDTYRRDRLESYYDLAAHMLQVEPLPSEHSDLPKRVQLMRAARDSSEAARAQGRGEAYLRAFAPPLAVNFQREENEFGAKQKPCDLAGNCCFGCPQRAKNTLDLNYLRRAEERGAEVITLAEVVWIDQLQSGTRGRFGIEYRDHLAGGETKSLYAEHVFVCAGAVNTTELLLRCREAGKIRPTGEGWGGCFHPNQDALSVVFDCDEPQDPDRGPTITTSLVYDREPHEHETSTRWRLAFSGAHAEPTPGTEIACGEDGWARVAAPAYRLAGSYEDGGAEGELTLADLRGSFPVGAELTTAAGSCGRVAAAPRKLRHWFLFQEGGMPLAMEPALGVFRSPLWLRRNAYRERPADERERPACEPEEGGARDATQDARHAAASQRIGYAALPFEALTELVSGLTRSAAGRSLSHEVGERALQLGQAESERKWGLLPDQLDEALQRIQQRALDDVGLAAEELVASFLDDAARELDPLVQDALSNLPGISKEQIEQLHLAARGLRLGVQLLWGSQSGMARAVAQRLVGGLLPEQSGLAQAGVELLRRLLDYRLGDGRTAVLLAMGLDSAPGTLELELPTPQEPPPGTGVRGVRSGTRAILVKSVVHQGSRLTGDAEGDLFVTEPDGEFEPEEVLLAGNRPIGVFAGQRTSPLPLVALRFLPCQPARGVGMLKAPLRARLPEAVDSPERGVQERILRDLASAWGGELRTDPLWAFLGRRLTVHAQGGCPMGPPERGVTDTNGQVYGCPGLYVMDAAAFPGPVGANPSATIAAIAEYKIARFLEAQLGRRDPKVEALAKRREDARRWVDESGRPSLDPLGPHGAARTGPRSALPAHSPVGIQFTEKMVGSTGGVDEPVLVETLLTACIEDLSEFLGSHARDSTVPIPLIEGSLTVGSRVLEIDPDASFIRVMADRGPDESGREVRTLEYTVVARREDGGSCILEGWKTVRDDEGADVWEDTTTLDFRLAEDGEPLRRGKLRLPASEFFGRQVPSFEVNTDDPARQAWAMASFGRFFLGHLVDVYLPALDRLGELAAGLVRRGHG